MTSSSLIHQLKSLWWQGHCLQTKPKSELADADNKADTAGAVRKTVLNEGKGHTCND